MGGGGFGSLDSMIKTIRNNAGLLRRKGMFQVLKENKEFQRKKAYKYNTATPEEIASIKKKVRVYQRKRNIKLSIVFILVIAIVSTLSFYIINGKYHIDHLALKFEYPKSVTKPFNNKIVIRTQYFDEKSRAVEETLLIGKKHGKSTSWYPTGELFRNAFYQNDSLLNEIYFYPSGSEVINFKKRFPEKVAKVKLIDRGTTKYTFYCSEGKIVPNTFRIASF